MRSTSTLSSVEHVRQQVVRERALGGDALELHRDRLGLPAADPDGQVALALRLAEDDDVLRGKHVDADALDDHLAQPRQHRSILHPRAPGQPESRSPRSRRSRLVGFSVADGSRVDGTVSSAS